MVDYDTFFHVVYFKIADVDIANWHLWQTVEIGCTASSATDDMLDVDLYIVVEYGISVSVVCSTIVQVVKYKLESMTGVKVRKVNISVEGIRVQ